MTLAAPALSPSSAHAWHREVDKIAVLMRAFTAIASRCSSIRCAHSASAVFCQGGCSLPAFDRLHRHKFQKGGRIIESHRLLQSVSLIQLTVALGQGDDRQGITMLKASKRIRKLRGCCPHSLASVGLRAHSDVRLNPEYGVRKYKKLQRLWMSPFRWGGQAFFWYSMSSAQILGCR